MEQLHLLRRLRNQDFPEALRKIVSAIEEEQFEVEIAQTAFDNLKTDVENLSWIKANDRQHPLTEEINIYRQQRHRYISSMKGIARSTMRGPFEQKRMAARKIYLWLHKEREFTAYSTLNYQSQTVHRMMHDLQLDNGLQEALTELALTDTMDELVVASNKVKMYDKQHLEDEIANKKIAKQLREDAYQSLRTFVDTVELIIKLKQGNAKVHQDYLDKIERIVSSHFVKVASRYTRKQNAEEEEMADSPTDASDENDGQASGEVQSKNGKPAMVDSKHKFGGWTPNGMDLHNGESNGSWTSKDAMDESATNGEATKDVDEPMIAPTTGNGGMDNDDANALSDVTETKHHNSNGVNENDSDGNLGDE